MEKKEIQEQRMRQYFIDAAKEIIKGEGLKCISTRNVSDRAGYSYATMYNYFKNINDLVFVCVGDFKNECLKNITSQIDRKKEPLDIILQKSVFFMKYFIEYTGVFELFYLEKINDIHAKQSTTEIIYNFFDEVCNENSDWDNFIKEKDSINAKIVFSQLKNLITGMMLFYINRRQPNEYKEFMENSEKNIQNLLLNLK